ncbi:MAG: MFS transporter [Alphaproteobacteria bacterium]
MIHALKPVFALMLAAAIFLMGNGLQTTLVPLAAGLNGVGELRVGMIGSLYFIGFAAGCLSGSALLARTGHPRAYAAMTALAGAAAVLYTSAPDPFFWAGLRMATGFAFAILYMVIESWLNEVATNKNRGTIFATYTFMNLTFVTLGQSMIILADPTAPVLFAVNAVLIILAAIPVLLSNAPAPAPIKASPIRLGVVFRAAPAGVLGGLAVGLGNGAFWSLAPNYSLQMGLDVDGIALFMAIGVLAGAAGQIPLGRLSDLSDRRRIIAGAATAAALAALYLGLFVGVGPTSMTGIMAGICVFGFFAFPVYALSVAHVNDRVEGGGFVEAAGAMLLLYAGGAVVGPILAATAMKYFGATVLFQYIAAVYGLLVLGLLARIGSRRAAPEGEREAFVAVPRPSPAAGMLDPRAEG